VDQTSSGLLRSCNDALRNGADFPTVWQTIMRPHWLVRGLPEQHLDGDRSLLRIRLATGQSLMFDSAAKRFSIE
jgi:hypothetical protein